MSKNKRFQELQDTDIAEIREIFTLFDKDSDGYVKTEYLGDIMRALNLNPTKAEVKEMEKDVDPGDQGSFDQMNLISLVARTPRDVESVDEMIEAIKVLLNDGASDERSKESIEVSQLKFALESMGEKLEDYQVDELLKDVENITHEGSVQIDDLAEYIMSR